MKFRRLTALMLSASMLFAGTAFAADGGDNEFLKSGEYQAFENVAEYISERYIDDGYSKEDIMMQGISKLLENNDPLLVELLKTTLESMDDYSEFYTPEEFKQFQDSVNSTFYGIGITMHMGEDGYVEVVGFAENSDNAQKAGFKIGDKICKVNGEDVTGLTMQEVRSKVIGKEGTTVDITVLRDNREINLTATRIAISETTVSSGILDGNIGYIQIISFSNTTAEDFKESLDTMRSNGVTKIILDLRNNGGGLVSAAVEVAKSIVPKGKIIDVKYRQSEYNATYTSNLDKKEFDIVTLVNENTASSAEILASAIQDSKAGKLVGVKTFGKAVIQNTYPLTNGSAFKITVGKYVTRNGNEINHVGLMPDVEIENEVKKIDTTQYTPFDYSKRTALGASDDNTKSAKEKLSLLGYYEGETDGVFDQNLKTAVKSFQMANDIFSYGVLDAVTQAKIDELFSQIMVTNDFQLKKAYELMGGNVDNLYK